MSDYKQLPPEVQKRIQKLVDEGVRIPRQDELFGETMDRIKANKFALEFPELYGPMRMQRVAEGLQPVATPGRLR